MDMHKLFSFLALLVIVSNLSAADVTFDLLLRNGTIYDGSGKKPFTGDVAILGDKIAAVGKLKHASARSEIDASSLAIAPGFINMLSWATESLIQDGRSQGDIRQGERSEEHTSELHI